MKIEELDLYHLRLPLAPPFEISSGRLTHIDTIVVRLRGEGEQGWGEAPPWHAPIYGPETAETAFHMIRDIFAPCVVGRAFEGPEALNGALGRFRGNNFAKAALETAGWVLEARRRAVPLHALLGGDGKKRIVCGVAVGIEEDLEEVFKQMRAFLAEGYRRIKLKVRPGRDLSLLRAVRERFPDLPLHVDANSSYRLSDLDTLRRFDAFNLLMIEQPLADDDLVDHARLQREIRTPICLDESIKSAEDARKMIELGSGRIVNIKISRVGGLLEARRVHDTCAAAGIPCWVGGMLESAIGLGLAIEFATLPNVLLPSDIHHSSRHFGEDLTTGQPTMAPDGTFGPSTRPGLACEPDLEKIRAFTVKHWRAAGRAPGSGSL